MSHLMDTEKRSVFDARDAARIAEDAKYFFVEPDTTTEGIVSQIVTLLEERTPVMHGRHAIDMIQDSNSVRLYTAPLEEVDFKRTRITFAAFARCRQTVSSLDVDITRAPFQNFNRIALAFCRTWNADMDRLSFHPGNHDDFLAGLRMSDVMEADAVERSMRDRSPPPHLTAGRWPKRWYPSDEKPHALCEWQGCGLQAAYVKFHKDNWWKPACRNCAMADNPPMTETVPPGHSHAGDL